MCSRRRGVFEKGDKKEAAGVCGGLGLVMGSSENSCMLLKLQHDGNREFSSAGVARTPVMWILNGFLRCDLAIFVYDSTAAEDA